MATEITIHDLMEELQTWHQFSPELMEKAKSSNLSTKTNAKLRLLVRQWETGMYDDDMEILCQRIESILNK